MGSEKESQRNGVQKEESTERPFRLIFPVIGCREKEMKKKIKKDKEKKQKKN